MWVIPSLPSYTDVLSIQLRSQSFSQCCHLSMGPSRRQGPFHPSLKDGHDQDKETNKPVLAAGRSFTSGFTRQVRGQQNTVQKTCHSKPLSLLRSKQ
jgi:hypothetical protein